MSGLAFQKPTREDRKRALRIDTSGLPFARPHFDRDEQFKDFVREHLCILSPFANHECGGITEFAHLVNGAMSRKCSDYFGVPLCTNHHTAGPGSFHNLGSVEAFDSVHGTDLWRENAELLAAWIRRRR
jgi:hypothetical protein